MHLSLSIPRRSRTRKNHSEVTIYNCLDTFFAPVTIQMKCSSCKEVRDTTMKTEIVKLPTVLLIVLKRYKTKTDVNYPDQDLDLSHYTGEGDKSNHYSLCAISVRCIFL